MNQAIALTITALLSWSVIATSPAGAASDPRFFGTYCGEGRFEECVRYRRCVKLFKWEICGRWRTRCEAVEAENARIRIGYREPAADFGVVSGRGVAKVEGERLLLDFGGVVTTPGTVRGRVVSNFFGPNSGSVRLSDDGLALSVHARGQKLTVRKDQCGNQPPEVTIESPSEGATLDFGEGNNFHATVVDDQADFARERMVFHSDRDGLLGYGKTGPLEASLWPYSLSSGHHVVTFTATDDGGLSDSAEIRVTVTNRPPETPKIVKPLDTLTATATVDFLGSAYDRESGPLDGPALVWELSADGSSFELLGTGQRLKGTIAEAGDYTLRLTAIDPNDNDATSSTEKTISVLPFTGNTPPRVEITGVRDRHGWFVPDLLALGERGIAVSPGEPLDFTATAVDDGPGNELTLEWKAKVENPPGAAATVFGDPELEGATIDFGNGKTASVTLYAVDAVTTAEVTVTFRAVDSADLENSYELTFYVLPAPLI